MKAEHRRNGAAKGPGALWLSGALVVTLIAFAAWWVTGADAYTKFSVVEQVPLEAGQDDPFAQAGLLDGAPTTTVVRREFRFGLLPTPQGVLDRHWLSVASTLMTVWPIALLGWLLTLRRARPARPGNPDQIRVSIQS